ncbi:class A beta-lactamase-related serine hydrolase [Thalassococcus profundi]|uniref:Class A beta-lactamase-related serine hydrolase n=1 Tax=Thalassococcus profundi TaxID=2282382 RepID=A0A369TNP3_9RHOB|nr:serine hydrolase domain-containing protein [Thalassococcus profundi]RDD66919.1 class A beta-lactamase-related serine hydrolase [Thalassococcus profundi]
MTSRSRLHPALAALLLWTTAALAQTDTPAPAALSPETLARDLRAASGAPAVGVGWYRNGGMRIATAGVRARGTDAAADRQDLWHIGSNGKAMTATLAARLVEAGVIGWNDTVGQRLGDLSPRAAYRDVTLEMLLAHRGGVVANVGFFSARSFVGSLSDRDVVKDRRDYAREVLGKDPVAEPGTEFVYSNAGYVVAGAMIEAATGQSWEELIDAWVFEPLDMETAGFGAPGNAVTLSQPRGHGGPFPWSRGAVAPGPEADNIPALGPAGTIHMSLRDHLKFLRAHLERPQGFLARDSWNRLQDDVQGQNYSLGWALRDTGALVHAGSNTLWFNIVLVDPERGIAVVLSANDGAAGRVRPAMEQTLTRMLPALAPAAGQ